MKMLEDRIRKDGIVREGNVLTVLHIDKRNLFACEIMS